MKTFRYHILLALAGGSLHGAEIRRRVEQDSGGEVVLYPAMLYGTLDELAHAGWISEVDADTASPGAQKRWRFYAITPQGMRALRAETDRLAKIVGRAQATLGATTS